MLSLVRPREAAERIGVSRSKLFEMLRRGEFVAPVRLSTRVVRFRSDEIDGWIQQRSQSRGQPQE
mgnify:CR=1 FL=1